MNTNAAATKTTKCSTQGCELVAERETTVTRRPFCTYHAGQFRRQTGIAMRPIDR